MHRDSGPSLTCRPARYRYEVCDARGQRLALVHAHENELTMDAHFPANFESAR